MSETDQPSSSGAAGSLVTAAFSFSLMSLFARLAGAAMPSLEVVFVRSLVSLALTVAFCAGGCCCSPSAWRRRAGRSSSPAA